MSEFEEENEMSNFEEEFNNCLHFGFIPNEPQNKIIEHFKYWQPPKPLVVVPQFVSDWFDINQDGIDGNIKALTGNINRKLKIEWSEMDRWFMYSPNKPIETLISMKLYGYTVEKEKLYLLKHIEISNRDTTINCYLTHTFTSPFIGHTNFSKGYDMSDVKECHFTQSEIDDMETGSYEQIAVTFEEA